MLLIACSIITTASADPTAAAPQRKPENVIRIIPSNRASEPSLSIVMHPVPISHKWSTALQKMSRCPISSCI